MSGWLGAAARRRRARRSDLDVYARRFARGMAGLVELARGKPNTKKRKQKPRGARQRIAGLCRRLDREGR